VQHKKKVSRLPATLSVAPVIKTCGAAAATLHKVDSKYERRDCYVHVMGGGEGGELTDVLVLSLLCVPYGIYKPRRRHSLGSIS